MAKKGKGKPGLSGDLLLDSALWQLAEVLAEIASPRSYLERDSEKTRKEHAGQGNDLPIEKEAPKMKRGG